MANPQSFNRYVYAMDNPLNNIDPTGLMHEDENGYLVGDSDGEIATDGSGGTVVWNATTNEWEAPGTTGNGNSGPGNLEDGFTTTISNPGNNIPFSVSIYLPVGYGIGGYTYTYTHIATKGQPTYNCSSHSGTISTPVAKAAVSGGPLTLFGQGTQSVRSVVSSWGWNFSLQATPWLGYQVIINRSGVVGGFTFGVPGASASYGWGSCTGGG